MWDTLFGGSCLGSGPGLVTFHLPAYYGYVVLTAVGSFFVLTWQGFQVGKMRKQYKITYPTMYSADNVLFNCYQRAHQNTLENYPQFLAMLLWGGLEMPVFTALAGVIWLAGRVAYSKGYYTGDPQKRMKGGFGYIGLFMMLGATIKFAVKLLARQ
jgi:glutathione S-transferase